ncbi:MAG: hypothetical protein M1514_01235 [Patescibacteria group bacterium]|nr:hypothetical protein [Patescibacteria group bacterium]
MTKNDEILGEIHAFAAEANSATTADEELKPGNELVEDIIKKYNFGKASLIQATAAFDAIRTLRVMGLDDKEIGQLVDGARYDPKTETYPKLEARLRQERNAWGIESNQEFEIIRRALLAKQDLEFHYQRRLAEKIATEVLEVEAGTKGWLRPQNAA